ncbi:hypothetical protein GA0070563_112102 [Micromonospora carbonacea]|uniref:Uncharacterized protein n=1 Tax=Micromonospora carbonacea TaxID=47853 RepID=A0A1C5AC66_9ACTN|nr:hypothetical protein GA0070563_112102 [Micromonospora carbonacea]
MWDKDRGIGMWDWLRAAVEACRRRTHAEVEAARDERRRALLMLADVWERSGDGRVPVQREQASRRAA